MFSLLNKTEFKQQQRRDCPHWEQHWIRLGPLQLGLLWLEVQRESDLEEQQEWSSEVPR